MNPELTQLVSFCAGLIVSAAGGAASLIGYVQRHDERVTKRIEGRLQPQIDELRARINRLETNQDKAVAHLTAALKLTAALPNATEATQHIQSAIEVLR